MLFGRAPGFWNINDGWARTVLSRGVRLCGTASEKNRSCEENEIAAGLGSISVALVSIGQQRRSSIEVAHCAICKERARRIGTNELFLMSRRLRLASTR